MLRLFLALCLLCAVSWSMKFNFDLKPGQRCFRENMPINTHVIGEAMVTSTMIPNFRIVITDEKKYVIFDKKLDHTYFHQELAILMAEKKKSGSYQGMLDTQIEETIYQENKGDLSRVRFAFSTHVEGVTTACLINMDMKTQSFDFELSHGIDAKDYANIAKKQNLKPAETDILIVEDFVKEMKSTAESIWVKESHKLEISETFNSNLIWSSVFSIVVIVAFAGFEYFIVKNYFKQKKLI